MLQVLGRLHPLLVHFPIALLIAALAAELLRPRREGPGEAGLFCLALGTAGAVLAALSGWLLAEHEPPGMPSVLFRHRWAGLGAAAGATATLVSAWRWHRSGATHLALPTRLGLALTAGLVALAGHLGGTLVYGEGFVLEPLRAARTERAAPPESQTRALEPGPREPSAGPAPTLEPPAAAPSPAAALPLAAALPPAAALPLAAALVDYRTQIVPLLARRCYECHGDGKRPKGNLRLTDLASVLARDPSEAALVPGDPEASLVYQRIVLPAGHEDAMPPEDGPLAPEEIELLRRWIAEGVRWEPDAARAGSAGTPPAPKSAPEAARGPSYTAAQLAARDEALERLRERGARAARRSRSDETVEVDLGLLSPPAGDAELALLAGLEPFLVELSLARSTVTDAGLAALAAFPALERLRLEHTALGAAGLAALAELPALASLNLFGSRVGDDAVSILARMPALARLYVGDSRLSAAALDELQGLRPGLAIVR